MTRIPENHFTKSETGLLNMIFLMFGCVILLAIFYVTIVRHNKISVVAKVQSKYIDDIRIGMSSVKKQMTIVSVNTGDGVIQCPVAPSEFHQFQPGDIGIATKYIESAFGFEDSHCSIFKRYSGSKANN